jgi:hypothetical protein
MNTTKLTWMNETEVNALNVRIVDYIESECEVVDAYEMYDNDLDEQGDICIGYLKYSPSRVLKEIDEIAYRCGFNDFMDSLSDDYIEIGSSYYKKDDIDDALEDLSNEIGNEFEKLHNTDEGCLSEIDQKRFNELTDYIEEFEF